MIIKKIDYKYPGSRFSVTIDELTIEPAKAYLLLGLNGSGKTTLLSILSGFLPSEGISMPSGYKAYLHSYGWADKITLTVRDFFLQTLLVLDKTSVSVDDILEKIGITEFKYQKLSSLSSGQSQRCLTEVAFLQDAPLLLFDEPMNALDFLNQDLFIAKTNLALQDGRSVIASSHIDSIMDIEFDSVLVMHLGKLIAVETVENIKNQNSTYKEYYEKTIRNIA
jgi:ABC-2 type transport system ATP-binding protein